MLWEGSSWRLAWISAGTHAEVLIAQVNNITLCEDDPFQLICSSRLVAFLNCSSRSCSLMYAFFFTKNIKRSRDQDGLSVFYI